MSELKAFKLEDGHEELTGGTVSYGPLAQTFDVAQALTDGKGVIVTGDEALQNTLAGYPGLVPAEVPAEPVHAALPSVEDVPAPAAPAEPAVDVENVEAVHGDDPDGAIDDETDEPLPGQSPSRF